MSGGRTGLLGLVSLACTPGAIVYGESETESTGESESTSESESESEGMLELVAGELTDPQTIVLTFSEALAPLDGVEPSDFRISAAFSIYEVHPSQTWNGTTYIDPNFWLEYYIGYYQPFRTIELSAGPQADQLTLGFEFPFNPIWAVIENKNQQIDTPTFKHAAGVFPHYSPGQTPVRSSDGDELAAIGAAWVLEPAYTMEVDEYGFPNLHPAIAIPTPPWAMP